MEIIINDKEFKKLSSIAQNEIISLMTSREPDNALEAGVELKPRKKKSGKSAAGSKGPYNMTPKMAKLFLSGCSKRTKEFLEVFIKNNGIGHVDELIKGITDKEYKTKRDLNGVLAGITRRIRKLDRNPKTHLLKWEHDMDENNKRGGYWRISKTTYKSLNKYIGT